MLGATPRRATRQLLRRGFARQSKQPKAVPATKSAAPPTAAKRAAAAAADAPAPSSSLPKISAGVFVALAAATGISYAYAPSVEELPPPPAAVGDGAEGEGAEGEAAAGLIGAEQRPEAADLPASEVAGMEQGGGGSAPQYTEEQAEAVMAAHAPPTMAELCARSIEAEYSASLAAAEARVAALSVRAAREAGLGALPLLDAQALGAAVRDSLEPELPVGLVEGEQYSAEEVELIAAEHASRIKAALQLARGEREGALRAAAAAAEGRLRAALAEQTEIHMDEIAKQSLSNAQAVSALRATVYGNESQASSAALQRLEAQLEAFEPIRQAVTTRSTEAPLAAQTALAVGRLNQLREEVAQSDEIASAQAEAPRDANRALEVTLATKRVRAALAAALSLETGELGSSLLLLQEACARAAGGGGGGDELLEATVPILAAAAARLPPSMATLQRQFPLVRHEALRGSLVPPSSGMWGHALATITAALKVTATVESARPNSVGGDAEVRLARAAQYLEDGKLANAVAEVDELTGLASEAAADWMSAAVARLAVDMALQVLSAHSQLALSSD